MPSFSVDNAASGVIGMGLGWFVLSPMGDTAAVLAWAFVGLGAGVKIFMRRRSDVGLTGKSQKE